MSLVLVKNDLLDLNYSKDLVKTTAASEYEVIYSYGTATQINYIYLYQILSTVRRATPSGANSLEIDIISSDDESYTDGETVTFQIGETDLVGLVSKDYIREVSFSTTFLFYKIKIKKITGANIQFDEDTAYIGRIEIFSDCPETPIKYTSVYLDNTRNTKKTYNLFYAGISESLRAEIYELERYKTLTPLLIWDKSASSNVLPSSQILSYVRVIEIIYTHRTNGYFNVNFVLEEIY